MAANTAVRQKKPATASVGTEFSSATSPIGRPDKGRDKGRDQTRDLAGREPAAAVAGEQQDRARSPSSAPMM